MTRVRNAIKRFFPAAVVLAILVVLGVRALRSRLKPDAEKIRDAVSAIVQNARERDVGGMLDRVSEGYADRFHADREALAKTLQAMWFRYKEVRVRLKGEPAVQIDPEHPDRASVSFAAEVRLGTTPGEEPRNDFVHRIRGTDRFYLTLRKEGGDWLVTGCTEKPPADAKFDAPTTPAP